jgi:tRNA-binding EMAP/Myf-like protein
MANISYDDFKKLEIRIGKIVSAEKVPDTDKLLKLSVDFGTKKVQQQKEGAPAGELETIDVPDLRQIVSGIAMHFPETSSLVGRKVAFAANLEPRMIRGLESQGMILAVGGGEEPFSLLSATDAAIVGSLVK